MTLSEFIHQLSGAPVLWVTVLLTLGVILVNGWTDAPNAIATCVTTRAMRPRLAIAMAAICNFLGVFVMTMLSPKVAETIYNMVDFGADAHAALIALCAAMFAIVVWAVLAWAFGIPTSESHALIAGLTGSAIAMHGNLDGVNGSEWAKVLFGLVFSLVFGFVLGFLVAKLIQKVCRRANYRKANAFFDKGQVVAAAGTAFMHGAQDGQKFMGVFLLGLVLARGDTTMQAMAVPTWLMVLCSLVMAFGTSIGGMKIIKSVGMDMVKLEKYQGFAADISATAGLLVCSLTGMPVSTTHAKTTAIMGVGAAKRFRSVNWGVAKEMVLTWLMTFPGCGLIGFLMTKLFIFIF
ncbi:MAG TPA: inorganic phosphate transporter [Candidatus Scatosoma pullistercoris]|uniref:Inorganic phosphate transporter n=1 Tax=Candidatus Scatosoma pullistercoris TaxID=2840934 RepID=A0A9D1SFS5_9FIRM|nr:inorganic phosphate transporter [Candidatus Scatosoma pullistercoris]